jgi:hypothetical protein
MLERRPVHRAAVCAKPNGADHPFHAQLSAEADQVSTSRLVD